MPTKTTIIYRPFLNMEVKQDVDTMLYNATDMVIAYERNTGKRKDTTDFFRQKDTMEYVTLLENLNPGNPVFKVKRGKYGGTWMSQELLIDFMMWLSVEFKHLAIKFIIEGASLAGKRHTIKEGYKRLTSAICEKDWTNYRDWATMINVLIMGSPASGQRARMTEEQMQKMDDLQTIAAGLIRAGMDMQQAKEILIKSL